MNGMYRNMIFIMILPLLFFLYADVMYSQYSGKCGFSRSFSAIKMQNGNTNTAHDALKKSLAQPVTQKNRVIGHFRVFYDTVGIHCPALLDNNQQRISGTVEAYVDSAGMVFNDVWNYEINSLGYSPPPLEGDGYYHIFIQDLPNLYGSTEFIIPPINGAEPFRYVTYIEIDNDFQGYNYYTNGLGAVKVTAAHEFFHAIQVGAYGLWNNDVYFLEIASTWMEDCMYSAVNDYYQYLSNNPGSYSEFSHPELCFTLTNSAIEYSRAIWAKYLEKRFSKNIIKRIFELMSSNMSITAMQNALGEQGTSLRDAYIEYAYWNSTTGPNCDTTKYYDEGKYYPTMARSPLEQYHHPEDSLQGRLQPMSNTYRPVEVDGAQMLTIISRIDLSSAYSSISSPFTYKMKDQADITFKHLVNGLYVKLLATYPDTWNSWESVPAVTSVKSEQMPSTFVLHQNYPNPFNPITAIKFSVGTYGYTSLRVYDVLGREVAILFDGMKYPGYHTATFDASKFASGMYFYQLKTQDFVSTRKMLLIK